MKPLFAHDALDVLQSPSRPVNSKGAWRCMEYREDGLFVFRDIALRVCTANRVYGSFAPFGSKLGYVSINSGMTEVQESRNDRDRNSFQMSKNRNRTVPETQALVSNATQDKTDLARRQMLRKQQSKLLDSEATLKQGEHPLATFLLPVCARVYSSNWSFTIWIDAIFVTPPSHS